MPEWKDDLINKMSATAVTVIVVLVVVGYFLQPVLIRWIDSKTQIELELIKKEQQRNKLKEHLDSLNTYQDSLANKLFSSDSDKRYYSNKIYPEQQLIIDSINVLDSLIKIDSVKVLKQKKESR